MKKWAVEHIEVGFSRDTVPTQLKILVIGYLPLPLGLLGRVPVIFRGIDRFGEIKLVCCYVCTLIVIIIGESRNTCVHISQFSKSRAYSFDVDSNGQN